MNAVHSGSDATRATTSVRPSGSTASTSPAVQSEKYSRRPSQRGDSTSPRPVTRTLNSFVVTSGSLLRTAGRCCPCHRGPPVLVDPTPLGIVSQPAATATATAPRGGGAGGPARRRCGPWTGPRRTPPPPRPYGPAGSAAPPGPSGPDGSPAAAPPGPPPGSAPPPGNP